MNNDFSRFADQCQDCTCYIENAEAWETVDPDCECSLGYDISGEDECEDFSE